MSQNKKIPTEARIFKNQKPKFMKPLPKCDTQNEVPKTVAKILHFFYYNVKIEKKIIFFKKNVKNGAFCVNHDLTNPVFFRMFAV